MKSVSFLVFTGLRLVKFSGWVYRIESHQISFYHENYFCKMYSRALVSVGAVGAAALTDFQED